MNYLSYQYDDNDNTILIAQIVHLQLRGKFSENLVFASAAKIDVFFGLSPFYKIGAILSKKFES